MMKSKSNRLFFWILVCFIGWMPTRHHAGPIQDVEVTLSASVEPGHVPLNRTAQFIVRLVWLGGIDRIEFGDVEAPVFTNLEVSGTASTHRVTGTEQGNRSEKEIIFTLRPTTLGMAYIEPVQVDYEDRETGQIRHLMTQRIGVEVLSPVTEKGRSRFTWIWIIVPLLLILGSGILLLRRGKRTRETWVEEPKRILEEVMLERLKSDVDLKDPDRREGIASVSRHLKHYLSEKYEIAALETTTGILLEMLHQKGIEESVIRKCEMLFQKADVIKFSGADATQAELDEAFTTVETILESGLARVRDEIREAEKTRSTKRKRGNMRKT